MRRRNYYWLLGVLILLIGVFLPRDWYDAMPTNPDVPPPPLKGVTLLQFVCVLEGLVLIWLALRRWTYVRLSEAERLSFTTSYEEFETVRKRPSMWFLVAITLLALSVRLLHLDADFWLDEIRATLDANEMSTLQVVASYLRSNVHLLNTMLMKLAIVSFGETEWAIRLPAVIFGTATIWAISLASRLALSRGASLGAALLLAVSYHHIFFSQNARGYTA